MTDAIASQRAGVLAAIGAHVAAGSRYALVDFPDHANVGDSAIWLGEITALRQVTGRDPDYVATWHDFDAAALRDACPGGTLFLHGGGNLGDIWPHHQRLREHVLTTVRDRPVVQLAQSIHFRDPAGIDRFAGAVAGHPAFTLYARDARSLAWARRHVGAAALAPDAAFSLGAQARAPADTALLLLLREDDERVDHGAAPAGLALDWLIDDAAMPDGTGAAARTAQAATRVARGVALLARGERLVTDRLHGHILATLLGVRHVVLDNDYGKIARYRATWPASPAVIGAAATLDEALALVAADAA